MPKVNQYFLDTGDDFPNLEIPRVGGGKISLPDDLLGAWGVVLFYRSDW
ncbi:MAG: redoxin domain-containing protein [Nitrospinae bacterium]|nr:redoxin domain-containing protein [Nitrospinota bacterium]